MTQLTHDARARGGVNPRRTLAAGLGLALLSAAAFGASGSIGRGLMDIGWTAGSATLVRVTIAALVLLIPGLRALRGQWHLLRQNAGALVAFSVLAIVGAQLCYFMAVQYIDVSAAMLIEYLAPLIVVVWLWIHGRKPTPLTFAGAVVAMAGLAMLVGLTSGVSVNLTGVAWALGAATGAAGYFIISGDDRMTLPPITLAAGGLGLAAVLLGLAAVVGILPMGFATGEVHFVPFAMPWWVALAILGVVTAALSYVAGIAAARKLGSRLASFVGLLEVVAAGGIAWLLLGQAMGPVQLAGAALVLAGVVLVKLAEPRVPAGGDPTLEEVLDGAAEEAVLADLVQAQVPQDGRLAVAPEVASRLQNR